MPEGLWCRPYLKVSEEADALPLSFPDPNGFYFFEIFLKSRGCMASMRRIFASPLVPPPRLPLSVSFFAPLFPRRLFHTFSMGRLSFPGPPAQSGGAIQKGRPVAEIPAAERPFLLSGSPLVPAQHQRQDGNVVLPLSRLSEIGRAHV